MTSFDGTRRDLPTGNQQSIPCGGPGRIDWKSALTVIMHVTFHLNMT